MGTNGHQIVIYFSFQIRMYRQVLQRKIMGLVQK